MAAALALLCSVAVALAAAPGGAAAAIGPDEALFQIPTPGAVAEGIATDPVTGDIFLTSRSGQIEQFTPWGRFVKAVGWGVAPGPVDEQQEVRVRASAGGFKLGFEGEQTAELAFDAPGAPVEGAESVQAALDALPAIGGAGGEVAVERAVGTADGTTPYAYAITFKGALAGTNVAQLTASEVGLSGGSPATALEVRTRADGGPGGSGLGACTVQSECATPVKGPGAGQMNVPRGLAVNAAGDVYVVEGGRVQELGPSGRFVRMWGGDVIRDGAAGEGTLAAGSSTVTSVATTAGIFRAGQPIEGAGIVPGTTIEAVGDETITLSKPVGVSAGGAGTALTVPAGANNVPANERQTIELGENVTGGIFTLTFQTPDPSPASDTTAALPADATAAEVREQLEGLTDVGADNVAVSGEKGGPWTVEFKGTRYADTDVEELEVGSVSLTVSSGEAEPLVSSENGAEVCEVAAECQEGAAGTTCAFPAGRAQGVQGPRVVSECQEGAAGAGGGQFSGGRYFAGTAREASVGAVAITLGGGVIYVADGLRIERFSEEGAYLGDLPDPSGVRRATPWGEPNPSDRLGDEEGVVHLAANPATGDLYFDFRSESFGLLNPYVYELDPATGALVRKIGLNLHGVVGSGETQPDGKPGALATADDGTLFVVDKGRSTRVDHVIEFSSDGQQLAPAEADETSCELGFKAHEDPRRYCEEVLGIFSESASLGSLTAGPAGDLYVVFTGEGVQAYGPPPLALESPSGAPPTIAGQYAASVGSGEAQLRARVNPHFFAGALGLTTYWVQYGTTACIEAEGWSAGCVRESPAVPGEKLSAGAVDAGIEVSLSLSGLEPATSYTYRFAAEGSGAPGRPVYGAGGTPGSEGTDGSFTTFKALGEPAACSNGPFRTGVAANLLDCRAYEMVSPLDKDGGDIVELGTVSYKTTSGLDQSSASGDKLAYATYKAFGDVRSAPFNSEYVAARGAGGWRSHAVSPPRTVSLENSLAETQPEFFAFSDDLCQAWVRTLAEPPLAPGAAPGYLNLYRWGDGECAGSQTGYETLITAVPHQPPGPHFQVVLDGLAEDGAAAFVDASGHLTADAPNLLDSTKQRREEIAEASPEQRETRELHMEEEPQLYESTGGQLRFLCYLPDGKPSPQPCWAGRALNSGYEGEAQGYGLVLSGAISPGGQRVFWTTSEKGAMAAPVYLREHPSQPQSALTYGAAAGTGRLRKSSTAVTSLVAAAGTATLTAGSDELTDLEVEVGEFIAGQPIAGLGIPAGSTVEAVSGQTLTLSAAVEAGGSASEVEISSEGPQPFAVGQSIRGEGIAPGTTITAVAPGELTLSAPALKASKSKAPLAAISECSEPEKACTIQVTLQAEEEAGADAEYWTASADGSRVLFTAAGTLYEATIAEDGEGHVTAQDKAIAPGVIGELGASEDAMRVYFASSEQLTAQPNGEGRSSVAGQPNLYLYDATRPDGQRFAFIGTLPARDVITGSQSYATSPFSFFSYGRSAQVTPSGLYATFDSTAPLTGYDNTDQASAQADTEVFLYEAAAEEGAGRLVCVSCNQSGARPAGRNIGSSGLPFWVAANLPTGGGNDMHVPHYLAGNGGRLFFDSFDALLPADSNGQEDVYEWEAPGSGGCSESSSAYSPANHGCIALISSGTSPEGSQFLESDPEGENVFFTTLSSLVEQDPGLVDVYDARVGGGFPPPAEGGAGCEGEACQSTTAPPGHPTPATALVNGIGNIAPAPNAVKSRGGKHRKGGKHHKGGKRGKGRKHGKARRHGRARRHGKSRRHGKARRRRGAGKHGNRRGGVR